MNIFILDYNQKKCAQYHNNKHVVKMILETAQLLSSAYYNCVSIKADCTLNVDIIKTNYPRESFIKLTHQNHPCSKWTRQSIENFNWLLELFKQLLTEYTFRYNKIHKMQVLYSWFLNNKPCLPQIGVTDFALAMPEYIREAYWGKPIDAYRMYYILEKGHLANWGQRNDPEWYNLD